MYHIPCCEAKLNFGDIAQLVERCVRNAEVRGSSPLISTNGEPGEPGTAIYFVGPVFILALPLPRRR